MITDYHRFLDNPLFFTDCYNLSHFFLKKNVDWEVSHIYNRNKPMVLFGFADRVLDILNTEITHNMVDEALEFAEHMGLRFPEDLWRNVVRKLNGHIPLKVEAVPEGIAVPRGCPFAQISNTVEGYGEIVTYFEAPILHSSFSSACATQAWHLNEYCKNKGLDNIRIHSFGYRGHNSQENAFWAGRAWNLFMTGTDDFHSIKHATGGQLSIAATAHKTIQQFDDELEAYYYSIDQAHNQGLKIVALVIDTYDPWRFIKHYSKKIAEYASDKAMTVVFRPDSGDVEKQAMELYAIMSNNGLLANTSCIIGEGMDFKKIKEYDALFEEYGMDLKWFNYGLGAGYYKHLNRDTLGFAMKTAYSNGADRMKFSADPIKQSIPGRIRLEREGDKITVRAGDEFTANHYTNLLKEIYYSEGFPNTHQPPSYIQTKANASRAKVNDVTLELSYAVQAKIEKFREKYLKTTKIIDFDS